jgi:hypothetical protein
MIFLPSCPFQTRSKTLSQKAAEFDDVLKTGRTHLMDAMPVRLGQEFGGYAAQIEWSIERLEGIMPRLCELPLGGTAVGTGINSHKEFGSRIAAALAQETGVPFKETRNHFAAQATLNTCTELTGVLKTLATALYKIANDLRWMNSGPQAGLQEIRLPTLQPGSSIMPGKINPVICEAVMMASMQVMGDADLFGSPFTEPAESISPLPECRGQLARTSSFSTRYHAKAASRVTGQSRGTQQTDCLRFEVPDGKLIHARGRGPAIQHQSAMFN